VCEMVPRFQKQFVLDRFIENCLFVHLKEKEPCVRLSKLNSIKKTFIQLFMGLTTLTSREIYKNMQSRQHFPRGRGCRPLFADENTRNRHTPQVRQTPRPTQSSLSFLFGGTVSRYRTIRRYVLKGRQCFGSGFVFYGSGSWIFPSIRIQTTKNKFFEGKNKIFGENFVFNPKSRYFIFVFNQSST